jgi:hypothetical protein
MDNGLIFPYRLYDVPDEPGDANHPKHALLIPFAGDGGVWSVGSDPVVVKRWGDTGR